VGITQPDPNHLGDLRIRTTRGGVATTHSVIQCSVSTYASQAQADIRPHRTRRLKLRLTPYLNDSPRQSTLMPLSAR
jgi:hypothetical protein